MTIRIGVGTSTNAQCFWASLNILTDAVLRETPMAAQIFILYLGVLAPEEQP